MISANWQEWEQAAKLTTKVLVKGHAGFDWDGGGEAGKWVDLRDLLEIKPTAWGGGVI